VIPRQLCDNAGFDATDMLNKLRQKHALADGSGKVRSDMLTVANYCACTIIDDLKRRAAGDRELILRCCGYCCSADRPVCMLCSTLVLMSTLGVWSTPSMLSCGSQHWSSSMPYRCASSSAERLIRALPGMCHSEQLATACQRVCHALLQQVRLWVILVIPLLLLCCLQSATEAACLILSVDETVKNPRSEAPDAAAMGMGGRGGGRGMRGRGRGMRR
jgi:hypothetical protein